MKTICAVLVAILLQPGGTGITKSPSLWRVNKVALQPKMEEWKQRFTASVTEVKQGKTYELSADVPETK